MALKKIAIIGSNSFSGGHLVDYLLRKTNYIVIGISRSSEKEPEFLPYLYKGKKPSARRYRFHKLDVNKDVKKLAALLDSERPDIVVNFAAQGIVEASWKKPLDWFRTNCLGIVALADHLKDTAYLKKYIQISTPEIYGSYSGPETLTYFNPTTPYAASKGAGDLFLIALHKTKGFPVCFVRSANVYGAHQQLFKVIPKTVLSVLVGTKLSLHQGGTIKRSFIHIEDVCRGIELVIQKGKSGGVYHFSTHTQSSIRGVVELVCRKMGVRFNEVAKVSEGRPGQDKVYALSFGGTAKALGWKPRIPLERGVEEVISWLTESWDVLKKYPREYIHQP